ncbi:g9840 [Coccomyxa viridis]|uniref:G9840 protein n=1 Tax=Coccomyxa viridis TaxID=1274662 RepID=A0ABP1G407_9CHLO
MLHEEVEDFGHQLATTAIPESTLLPSATQLPATTAAATIGTPVTTQAPQSIAMPITAPQSRLLHSLARHPQQMLLQAPHAQVSILSPSATMAANLSWTAHFPT